VIVAQTVVNLTPQARVMAALLALAFVVGIIELIRRKKLTERYSVLWFALALVMLVGALFPGLLALLAGLLGVRDAAIALFSLLGLLLLLLALQSSITASRQSREITRLAQVRQNFLKRL
jgi:hypothetical protein